MPNAARLSQGRGSATAACANAFVLLSYFCFFFAVLVSLPSVAKGEDRWDDESILHVHVIPHSHCDPGWLDTFEGYFRKDVNHILTNVLAQLWNNPNRRFIWAEISFFKRWWDTLDNTSKERFKTVVARGQLEFVGGGWVQNDESNPTMESVINQVSTGHDFLLKTFGIRPKIGWQIDPFGHSAMTASLFAMFGYDAMVINRIHYDTKKRYKATRHMEFLWEGAKLSDEKDLDLKIFTHVLHTHYSAPRGFDFENPGVSSVSNYNAAGRARQFVSQMKQRQRAYMTNHILVPFGDDFKFKQAARQFSSMDNVINAVNNNHELNVAVRYSTLSEYFQAVHRESTVKKTNFPVYRGDFFPYADNGDSYWSGYYTTRPTLKAATRVADSTLRAVEAAYAMGRAINQRANDYEWEDAFKHVQKLREEASLVLHHDAITGTSRATVVRDYLSRLTTSRSAAMGVAADVITGLLRKRNADGTATKVEGAVPTLTSTVYRLSVKGTPGPAAAGPFQGINGYPVVVQNPLGWRRQDVVKVLLESKTSVHEAQGIVVMDEGGKPVAAQVQALLLGTDVVRSNPGYAFGLFFKVDLPPLGVRTYYVRQATKEERLTNSNEVLAKYVTTKLYTISSHTGKVETPPRNGGQLRGAEAGGVNGAFERPSVFPEAGLTIENNEVLVKFQSGRGLIKSVTSKGNADVGELEASQEYMYYTSSRSGAYIFRPHGQAHGIRVGHTLAIAIAQGPLVQQVQYFDDNTHQSTRVLSVPGELSKVVQILTSVTASMNNEVVVRFNTNLGTNHIFYSDNSVDMQKREHSSNKPIPANFYPMNTAASLKTDAKQMTFINRQPMGVASLVHEESKSSLEVMLHRCLSQDDGRGLAQGVHDSSRTQAPLWMIVGTPSETEAMYRRVRHHLQHGPLVYLASGTNGAPTDLGAWTNIYQSTFQPFGTVDENIHILSLKARDAHSDDILVRIQNLGDRVVPVRLQAQGNDGAGLLLDGAVEEIRSRSISANQPSAAVVKRLHYPTAGEVHDHSNVDVNDHALTEENQNTEEEGVFLSDAALAKLEEDKKKGSGRRALLASGAGGGKVLAIPPYQVKTYFVELNFEGASSSRAETVASGGLLSKLSSAAAKISSPFKAKKEDIKAAALPPPPESAKESDHQGAPIVKNVANKDEGSEKMPLPKSDTGEEALGNDPQPVVGGAAIAAVGIHETGKDSNLADYKSKGTLLFGCSVAVVFLLMVYLKFCKKSGGSSRRRRNKSMPKRA
jgi:alpha-mannosidase II